MAVSFADVMVPAVVGLITGGLGGYLKDRLFLGFRLNAEQQHEQRRKLAQLQVQYKGRVLEAALDWDRRMKQLYEGAYDKLDAPDDDRGDEEQYYFHSVVFRFLQLMTIARRFEAEALYIDPSFAKPKEDGDLLRHCKAFLWVMLHAELSPDDDMPGRDHFRSDTFRPILDLCVERPGPVDADGDPVALPETLTREGELIFDLARYQALVARRRDLKRGDDVEELLRFFDEVRPEEYDVKTGRQRRRWDRLVALHLMTLVFVESCGYEWQHRDIERQIAVAASMLMYPDTLRHELAEAMPKVGFEGDQHLQSVLTALDAVIAGRAAAEAADGRPAEPPEIRRARHVHAAINDYRETVRGLPAKHPAELLFSFGRADDGRTGRFASQPADSTPRAG